MQGDALALPFEDEAFDAATVGFGARNLDDLERGLAELRRVLRPGGRLAILEITQPRGVLAPFYRLWFDRLVPLLGRSSRAASAYTYLPASVRRFPGPEELAEQFRLGRVRGRSLPALRRRHRRAAHRSRGMSLATIRESPGLDVYLEKLEERLTAAVQAEPGLVAAVGGEALVAGGKRLRPLLVFLAAPPGEAPSRGRGGGRARAHGDARPRRPDRPGALPPRPRRGVGEPRAGGGASRRRLPLRARVRRAGCDRGRRGAVRCLAGATLSLARGEALQRAQTNDPETSVESYLERCALKTGKLFEAACLLGSGGDEGLGEFGLALGIAFQIADDILDCSGETIETGKIAGTDLREGTPTLPLILAAREDENVRRALAGGPLDGALLARRRDRRARGLPRARARLRAPRARLPGRARSPRRARGPHRRRRRPGVVTVIRLGRISYVNMAPVFYRLEADVEEVQGVPTELNARLLSGELDLAPISSIEYARNADRLRLLPRLCVSSEGAVDSIQLVSRGRSSRCGAVAVTPESATSVVLTKVLLPEADHVPLGEEADATLLIGDAALKSAFEDPTPHHDLGRLWLERTGLPMVFAVWACPEPVAEGLVELEQALVESVLAARAEPEQLAYEASERYGYPAGFLARYFEKLRYRFGPRERAGLFTFLELARDVGELDEVPELRFVARAEAAV